MKKEETKQDNEKAKSNRRLKFFHLVDFLFSFMLPLRNDSILLWFIIAWIFYRATTFEHGTKPKIVFVGFFVLPFFAYHFVSLWIFNDRIIIHCRMYFWLFLGYHTEKSRNCFDTFAMQKWIEQTAIAFFVGVRWSARLWTKLLSITSMHFRHH